MSFRDAQGETSEREAWHHPAASARTRLPLSPYQRDIWIASRQFPHLDQYTIFICEKYEGTIDRNTLRRAVRHIAEISDAFRLRFGEDDGNPFQRLCDRQQLSIAEVELAHEGASSTELQSWLEERFDFAYQLDHEPLVDLAILQATDAVYVYVRTHHILCDAWGLQSFMRQVRAEYLRRLGLETPHLVSKPFVDVIGEESYLGSDQHKADRAYFAEALTDAESALFTRKRPNGGRRTARRSIGLERSLIAEIRKRGQSPFVLISGAVALYLARVHQTGEVVLGIPTLNRDAGAKQTIGHFANTLPLRIEIDPASGTSEFLAKLRDDARLLLRHQRLPLGELMRGRAPLFDTTISYMRWPNSQDLPGVSFETMAQTHAHDTDALAIWISEFDMRSDVRVDFEYACDVFDDDFPIGSAIRHIETLLRALADGEDQPLIALDPLSRDEHRDLIHDRNATEAEFPREATLSDLFAAQADRTPHATALVHPNGTSLSFSGLTSKVMAVAAALRAMGVGRDDRVAILLERGEHQIPAILGVQLAGGAYVPVDPTYPIERMMLLLADCGAKVAIVGGGTTGLAEISAVSAVLRMADLSIVAGDRVSSINDATDLAYVIYTSGSTGKPKGVMVEHRSIVNRLWWMQRRYPVGERDVLLQKTPMSFDVSVWELFWWSFTGARLSLLPPGAEKDPREVLGAVERDGVTVIHFVPSMLSALLDLLDSQPEAHNATTTLRLVFCSGEALAPAQVVRFNRIFGDRVSLVNLYGPTEATVDVSYFDCLPGPLSRIPIGKPIDNIQLYVLDRMLRPQPPGAAGELYIGGVGVARGYLNRADLDAERFIPNPFKAGDRLYRTGDVARWLADGNVEYMGRIDDQVKVRGNRVEPNEVRDHLAALPGIRDAAVIARHSTVRDTHLVGYYLADEDYEPATLRAGLAAGLPEFMIPAFFVRIDRIPLTANGKIDRKQLPSPPETAVGVGPRTPIEAILAAVWAEVLGVQAIGVFDDFYTLGGDSILMLRVRSDAQRRGVDFELADLIRNPTVAGLAEHVNRSVPAAANPTLEPFALVSDVDRPRLVGLEDAFPASRLSLGLLYHTSQNPDAAIYHDVFRYRLEMPWNEMSFRRAVRTVIKRFPVLRSSFDLGSHSEPLQLIHPVVDINPLIVDMRGRSDLEPVIAEHVRQRRFHQYEIDRAPLCMFAAFVGESDLNIVFSFHHAILDGWSVASLVAALVAVYRGEALDQAEVPPLASYVREERRSLASRAHAKYWSELLDDAKVTKFDGFGPHEPAQDDATSHHAYLPAELLTELRDLAAKHSAPLKSVLLAAHCLTLHMFSLSKTVVTGVVTHGRPDLPGADRMVGLFLNTVPIRTEIEGRTWLQVVLDVVRQERHGHPYRRFPLSAIRQARGDALHTAFNYVNLHVFDTVRELRSFQVWEETNFSPLVNVIVDPAGNGTYVRVDRGGNAIGLAQAQLVAEAYIDILRRMVGSPAEAVDFGSLARRRLVAPAPEPLIDVVSRFTHQVRIDPAATAVAFNAERWTYRDLDRMSLSVATRLVAAGAKPGDAIGVALNRSVEMIATVWGILRAGMACVPLDVSYPANRLSLIIETARPHRVVAHPEHAHLAPQEIVLPVSETISCIEPASFPTPGLDDLALLLFTSGSTGKPKGVELTHRTWANFIDWQLTAASGIPGARTLQFAPLSFDVAFGDIFSALCSGGELRLISDQDRLDPIVLLRLLDRFEVERVALPFVAFQRLAEASNALDLRPRALRVVISSGEQLRMTEDVRAFCAAIPGVMVENQYGPTEAYVVSHYRLTGDPALFPALPPIGRALPGVEIQVLDKDMRPVPVGVIGEIYLGGACLARGYHRAPELTRDRFLPHPWRQGATLYRTGDLGRELASGDLVWLGRADDQVKVRGFRIEPAEVELAILRQPGLREVAVVARGREGTDSFLAAFLVGDRDMIEVGRLEKALRAELPDYMIPAHFVWMDAFPSTPSGKRDDAALRAYPITFEEASEQVLPRNEHERALAELLAELLDLPSVGVRDDFFALGGTSLTAMRFVVTIEKRYGVNIPIAALIQSPTIEGLAERLKGGPTARGFDPLVPIRTAGDRPPIFLIHPLGGHVLCYMPLCKALPAGRPLYALQAAGSEQGSVPFWTVEEMAESYIEAVRRVRSEGPFIFAGWSFGGFVAFEMARQIRALLPGENVHVIMLDTIAIPPDQKIEVDDNALLEFFYWELVWFERTHAEVEPLPPHPSLEEKLDHILGHAVANGVLPNGTPRASIRRLYTLFQASWSALINYRPHTTDMDVALLRATGSLPPALEPMHHAAGTLYDDPKNGWQYWVTGALEVIDLPGDHLNLMSEPNVGNVARTIADLLDPEGPDRHAHRGSVQ